MGRSPKYNKPEKMQHAIDLYFKSCRARQVSDDKYMAFYEQLNDDDKAIVDRVDDVYPSVTGMAILLGFTSRNALLNYEENDKFIGTIKAAKVRIENAIEQRLFYNNPTGSIFNLKNNYGWVDKIESDVTTKGESINKDATNILLSKVPTELLEQAIEEAQDSDK